MFKKKIAGLLAAMMCVSLIGCGGDKPADETKKAETEETGSTSADSDVIKMAVGADRVDFYRGLADEFEKQNPGKKVEIIEIVNGSDMYTKITMMMQSKETSPDLITEDGFMIMSDAEAGYLEPLDEFMKNWEDAGQFEQAILDGAKGS